MAGSVKKYSGPQGTAYRVRVEYPPDPTTGERRQRQKSCRTKKEADRLLSEWLTEIVRGTAVDTSNMTVGEFMIHWLDAVAAHNVRETTYAGYRWLIEKHIIPAIGSVPLQRLTASQVQTFYSAKMAAGCSSRLVHLMHLRLRQALTQAVKWNVVIRNVTDAVDAPTVRYQRGNTWTPAEARKFLSEALKDGYHPLWHLALASGMRRGELLGVRWQDIDFVKGTLRVMQNVVAFKGAAHIQEPKTPAARRTIILDPQCLSLLRSHREYQKNRRDKAGSEWKDEDLVFSTPIGGPINPNNLARNYKKLLVAADVPKIRFHDIRHTHATLLLQEGEAINTVSARLGHANPAITLSVYAHVTPKMQESAAVTIGRLLDETEPERS